MLKQSDVNEALIRQAVDELEIGVPIRSYEVVDGRLVLHLAYTLEPAVWEPPAVGGHQQVPRPANTPIPAGDLNRLRKPQLQELARIHGIAAWNRLRKGELVEALEGLREG